MAASALRDALLVCAGAALGAVARFAATQVRSLRRMRERHEAMKERVDERLARGARWEPAQRD